MAERWFTMPVVGTGGATDPYRPKYWDESGITGWSGQTVTINGSEYFVARVYGSTSALDTVESYSDATSIQESGLSKSDVAGYLNDETGNSYSFSEWEQRIFST